MSGPQVTAGKDAGGVAGSEAGGVAAAAGLAAGFARAFLEPAAVIDDIKTPADRGAAGAAAGRRCAGCWRAAMPESALAAFTANWATMAANAASVGRCFGAAEAPAGCGAL